MRALFRAQIEAGKAVQAAVLARPAAGGAPLDLATELRPALTRVGERIAALLVELPADLPEAALRRGAEAELALPGVSPAARAALADALVRLSHPR